ncbi:hypothetical protein HDU96_006517 [Phlyctochytrium bullatum]|nr:hypothetical protein HDU96_006517 [Phlyctochytrium bullatum]
MRLIAIRHGHSLPNAHNLIVSSPTTGTLPTNGLSPHGRTQAHAAGTTLAALLSPPTSSTTLRIVSSDFSRALETATIVHSVLTESGVAVPPIRTDVRLRERFFGNLDGGPSDRYNDVWAVDAGLGDEEGGGAKCHADSGVETVFAVRERLRELLGELREAAGGEDSVVVVVSHGDTLQILQTVLEGIPPQRHRSLTHLETAEVRELVDRTGEIL